MEDSSQSVEKPIKRKLRWYQFSLRTLLIVVTLFAIACSWFAVKMGQARRQKEAVETIHKAGGYVVYDHEWPIGKSDWVPQSLEKLLGVDFFHNVVGVGLNQSKNNPDDSLQAIAPHLATFERLRIVGLQQAPVTDKSIAILIQLKTLECLNLDRSFITDDGVAQLKQLPTLTYLSLVSAENLTDECVVHLQTIPRLKKVNLLNRNISQKAYDVIRSLREASDPFL